DNVANAADFEVINEAIRNEELLYSIRNDYVASKKLFLSYYSDHFQPGQYYDGENYFGRLRFTIDPYITAINIIDNSTIIYYYSSWLWEEGRCKEKGNEIVCKIYAGPIFGNMAYYGSPTYYTYQKVENKIIVTNGDIFTITSSGLIQDGTTSVWSKYDRNKRY
ncbi:MAG: hypothetical protein J6R36_05605, partial [Bacteroidaceae bacterium]|nr:hypothetical protein [Bacteroidaceae bacterium]